MVLWSLWSGILIVPASRGKDANPGRHLWNTQGKDINGESLQGQHSAHVLCEPWRSPGDCLWERNSAEGQCKVKFYLEGGKNMYKPRFILSCCRHVVKVAKFGVLSTLGSHYSQGRERQAPPEGNSAHLGCESPLGEPVFHPSCWKPSTWCAVRWILGLACEDGTNWLWLRASSQKRTKHKSSAHFNYWKERFH